MGNLPTTSETESEPEPNLIEPTKAKTEGSSTSNKPFFKLT